MSKLYKVYITRNRSGRLDTIYNM